RSWKEAAERNVVSCLRYFAFVDRAWLNGALAVAYRWLRSPKCRMNSAESAAWRLADWPASGRRPSQAARRVQLSCVADEYGTAARHSHPSPLGRASSSMAGVLVRAG